MYEKRISNCAERLTTALNIRKMKQSELCEKTKIPKSAMSQYISGAFEPKQDRLYLMANALNVSEVWLMGYDVPINAEEADLLKRWEELKKAISNMSPEKKKLFETILDMILTFDDDDAKKASKMVDTLYEKNNNEEG